MLDAGHEFQHGRYRIEARLSQGGMGTVYLAIDRNLANQVIAIKENADTSPETQQQFRREGAVFARLTHPNLPRVTDYFIEPSGRQYLVMDYVPGDDLRQILLQRNGPLSEAEALAWIEPVMEALVYMHSWIHTETGQPSPIIHRDIKPANIKRTPNGRTVLGRLWVGQVSKLAKARWSVRVPSRPAIRRLSSMPAGPTHAPTFMPGGDALYPVDGCQAARRPRHRARTTAYASAKAQSAHQPEHGAGYPAGDAAACR